MKTVKEEKKHEENSIYTTQFFFQYHAKIKDMVVKNSIRTIHMIRSFEVRTKKSEYLKGAVKNYGIL